MKLAFPKKFKIVVLVLFLLAGYAFADSNGAIAGQVVDEKSLQPLAGANIFLEGTSIGTTSDTEGFYYLGNIEPGSYTVEVQYIGYQTAKRNNVIVGLKRTTELIIQLQQVSIEGDAIEVKASYFVKPRESFVSNRSMDIEEIRRSPGDLVDIQRSVKALPAVSGGSDQLNEIIVRGGYPGENLFIMDNIEIPNPNHFADQGTGGGSINLLNSFIVRKLDFYAGAFSARFGDKASSVMEIFNREGSRESLRGELNMGMSGAGILVEGPIAKKGSYLFSARRSYLDFIVRDIGISAVPHYNNFQTKVVLDLNKKNKLLLNAVYGNDRIRFEGEDKEGFGRGAENVNTWNNQFIGGLTLQTFWNKDLFSNTTASFVKNNLNVKVYDLDSAGTRNYFFTSFTKEAESTLKTDFHYNVNKHSRLSFGASAKNIGYQFDTRSDADTLFIYKTATQASDSIFTIYPERVINSDGSTIKMAAYLQWSYDLSRFFAFSSGLRYGYFDYTKVSSWSPRLGISYQMVPGARLSLAYGRHYQTPGVVQLLANRSNKDLKSKYTDQIVFGLDYLIREDIRFTAETFYKSYHDVPILKTLATPDPFDFDDGTYINAGKGHIKGVELFLQKKLKQNFSAIASYSYSVAEAKDPRTGRLYNWDYDYRHVLNLVGGYRIKFANKKWYKDLKNKWWFSSVAWLPFMPADNYEISVKYRYLGGRPYTPPDFIPEVQKWVVNENQTLNTRRYPAYSRFDLRIDRRMYFNNWSFLIFVDWVNVLDRDNVWAYQYGVDSNGQKERKSILNYKTLPIAGFIIDF